MTEVTPELMDEYNSIDEDNRLLIPNDRNNYCPSTTEANLSIFELDSYFDRDLLKTGASKFTEFQKRFKRTVSQDLYYLMINEGLLDENINNGPVSSMDKKKKIFLRERFSLVEGKYIMEERTKRILIEPEKVFDMIMVCHLMNDHLKNYAVTRILRKRYCNTPAMAVDFVLRYCSTCREQHAHKDAYQNEIKIMDIDVLKVSKQYKQVNYFDPFLPLEVLQVEVIQIFDGEKIENKYEYLLFVRDFYSRFTWLRPIEDNENFKKIIDTFYLLLLELNRLPILIKSRSIEIKNLRKMTKVINERLDDNDNIIYYEKKVRHMHERRFLRNGITRISHILNKSKKIKEECLKDWKMCLRYGSYMENRRRSRVNGGFPNELLGKFVVNIDEELSIRRVKYGKERQDDSDDESEDENNMDTNTSMMIESSFMVPESEI